MPGFDITVMVLLGIIVLLLVATLGLILFAPGRLMYSKEKQKRSTHIYETIDSTDDDNEHNRVTQVLKIRVVSEDGEVVQQDMLIKVQVEAIPLPAQWKPATPSSSTSATVSSPPLSARPLLMQLKDPPKRPNLRLVDETTPVTPPRKLSVRLPVTPEMIKDPSLIRSQSSPLYKEHIPLVNPTSSMEETSGYLRPSTIRKDKSGLK